MTSSSVDVRRAVAQAVRVTADTLSVDLADGRSVSVPTTWFPRLAHGTPPEWATWELVGGGISIHWPSLDEDISVDDLLAGHRSAEAPASLQRWFETRRTAG